MSGEQIIQEVQQVEIPNASLVPELILPTLEDHQNLFDLRQILQAFVQKEKEFPPAAELAKKMNISEVLVQKTVDEINQQNQIQKEYNVRFIIQSSFKALVLKYIKPDLTLDEEGIMNEIKVDNTCCSNSLSEKYGVCQDKIDEMKANVIKDEIRNLRLNSVMRSYDLLDIN